MNENLNDYYNNENFEFDFSPPKNQDELEDSNFLADIHKFPYFKSLKFLYEIVNNPFFFPSKISCLLFLFLFLKRVR